ncbi:MAG: Lrp/AsnC ligand binding domain-containing protein [Candidatus Bathyarchaeota archaeon]|nr:MAG: Lrp/AsnC ligand binding domain-containing protein [Candidatus Bathyarchaeota archaeon]
MITAYVLIRVEVGQEHEVLKQLQSFPEITEVRIVYGEYDVVATYEIESLKALDGATTEARKLKSIINTLTLITNC